MGAQPWSAKLYDHRHAFVARYGNALLEWLAPQSGERILDLGCGTGDLTACIAKSGACVTGADADSGMLAQARAKFPDLTFVAADATQLPMPAQPYDAVFSNAVLHWIPDLAPVARGLARSLRPGGRFVAECGGEDCNAAIRRALETTLRARGFPAVSPFFFRPLSLLARDFEAAGLRVMRAEWFPRDTPLEGPEGMLNLLRMFFRGYVHPLPAEEQETLFAETVERLRPAHLRGDIWHADYTRQRFLCVRL